jgi:hypothetical protein
MMGLGLKSVPFLATYLTMDAILAAVLYQEQRTTGTVSRATWAGAAIIVVPQAFLPILMPMQEFRSFIDSLASLAYYR